MSFALGVSGPIRSIFWFHAIAGTLALSLFLVPLLTKKGGKAHIRAGWLYSIAMTGVSLTVFVITPWRFFIDPSRTSHSQQFAVFLFFISVFAISAVWHGLRALKFKARKSSLVTLSTLGPPIVLMAIAGGTSLFGLNTDNPLLTWFPLIALRSGWTQFNYWRHNPENPRHWWYAHMVGMFTACIATVTAFVVTAVPRLIPGSISDSIFLWIAPAAIMTPISILWNRAYRKKFGD